MTSLNSQDLQLIVMSLPKDVKKLLQDNPARIFLAGGSIRSRVAGEPISDYDLWGQDKPSLGYFAELFAAKRGVRVMATDNAYTILSEGRTPVQFITRWVFQRPEECAESFDFTIASAAVWHDGLEWKSYCHEHFYEDLAAKRLVYMRPERNEDAGGSLMRVQKFIRRGYSISPGNLAAVIARLTMRISCNHFNACDEEMRGRIILGLLREVDPLIVVDGCELMAEQAMTTDPDLERYYIKGDQFHV